MKSDPGGRKWSRREGELDTCADQGINKKNASHPCPWSLKVSLNCLPISRGCNYRSQKMKILQFGFSALQPSEATYLKMEVGTAVVRLPCKSVETEIGLGRWMQIHNRAHWQRRAAQGFWLFLVLKLRWECSQATQKSNCTTSFTRISCLSHLSSFSGCTLFRLGLAQPHWREAAWCAFNGHPLRFKLMNESFHVRKTDQALRVKSKRCVFY